MSQHGDLVGLSLAKRIDHESTDDLCIVIKVSCKVLKLQSIVMLFKCQGQFILSSTITEETGVSLIKVALKKHTCLNI